MSKVLIIDDDESMCQMLAALVREIGHQAEYALTLAEGLRAAQATPFDIVFLDVKMPDGNGLDILGTIKQSPSRPEVVIITGAGNADGAELAIRTGAWDYLQKPLSPREIVVPLERVLARRDQRRESPCAGKEFKRDGILGESPQLMACLKEMIKAAGSEANVLVTGGTGTGKELFSRAIHANSKRCAKPFVVVDCASLTETLIKSTLFGHERGAFTGADRSLDGLVKIADGGTLFLDEIGELSLSSQKFFLRFLEDRHFRPLGSHREITSNFRLICATNRNLEQMAAEGTFRRDLLYRVCTIRLELPALKDRPSDIPLLARHYAALFCRKYHNDPKELTPGFLEALQNYSWPGNVREFVNCLEEAVNDAGTDPALYQQHLPAGIRIAAFKSTMATDAPAQEFSDEKDATGRSEQAAPALADLSYGEPADATATLKDALLQVFEPLATAETLPKFSLYRDEVLSAAEKGYFKRLISIAQGNIKAACNMSGMSRSRLYCQLKRYGISRMGWPEENEDSH